MAIGTAAAVIGGSLAGGALASRGARSAARTQASAGDRAIAEQRRATQQARGDLQPFRELGEGVANPLLDFVREGPETDLERTEGFRDIQTSAAAAGKLRSGGTLKALTEFNNMLNSRNRNQRFNELFNVATLGANAASGQATSSLQSSRGISETITGQGNAQAAGRVGSANAQQSAINSMLTLALLNQGS